MTEAKNISPEQLRSLASAEGPCITFILPEREGPDARIAFKDALIKVRSDLAGAGISKRDIAALLGALESAAAGLIDSSKEPATFIFLRSPGICESFRTRYLLGEPVAAAGEYFHLFPLLTLAGKSLDFYILALRLNNTRILKCSDDGFERSQFPKNAGTDSADFIPDESQSSLRAEPVHDHERADDYLRHFYREVDRDVNALLKDGQTPLVVAGIERELAQFFRLTTYPACVKPGIHGLPDRLTDDELYRQSLDLVRSVTTGTAHHELENFDKKIGNGHGSSDLAEIVDAAADGRVGHLFLRAAGVRAAMVDSAILQTLRHGGDVRVLPEANLPGGAQWCAVFRYAAA